MVSTRLWVVSAALALATSVAGASPCAPSATALCLSAGRFEVSVAWKDFQGKTGDGQAVPLTADTGYFWFFSDSNIELIVKVLDARGINGKFWVFFGALSSVEYTLTVRDSESGKTKTYFNPSGQFASVGDTSAFEGSVGVAPTREMAVVEGTPAPPSSIADIQRFIDSAPATSTFVPCKTIASSLRLSSCRFSIEVSWRDATGKTGRGTPVQLTNDTGYFWFFGASNVELMVKILDARPINGNFWVFYGALSNVSYTLTVTDSLSGALRTYTNASGTFASVGDTGAFHPGRTVAAAPDSGRAVFADIDSAGGSLSATAADGTHFVLDVPSDALLSQTSIRMTPLSSVGGLPLSRGLIGGVQLEPEGLRLLVPARLTIHPPRPLRLGSVAFAYRGSGEDLWFDPSEVENGDIRLQILHFSGYGAGTAGSGDVANQASYAPMDPVAAIRQRVLEIIERAQPHEDENGNEIPPEITLEERYQLLKELFINAFFELIIPRLQAVLPDCNREAIREATDLALGTIRMIEFFTDLDQEPELKLQVDGAIATVIQVLQTCLEKAHQDCVSFKDPLQAWEMVFIQRLLERFGAATSSILEAGGPIEKCLRFELIFDSAVNFQGGMSTENRSVHARVPLRIDPSHSTQDLSWAGTEAIRISDEFIDIQPCTTTNIATQSGTFQVGDPIPALLFPLALSTSYGLTDINIRFGYDPGYPQDGYSLKCAGQDVPGMPLGSYWRDNFLILHAGEYISGQGLLAKGWEVYVRPDLFARKKYPTSAPVGGLTESTTMDILHTPDQEP